MKSLHIALGISLTLLAACTPEKYQADLTDKSTLSPWHSLTAKEIREVAAAVTESVDGTLVFNRMSLLEPDKSQALSWQTDTNAARGADVLYRLDKLSYRVRYDFQTSELSSPALLTSGQPMLVGQELYTALELVNELPEVREVLEQRGVSSGDGLCLPRTVGRFFSDLADPINDRLVRFDCFNIRGQSGMGILPTTSAFARPIEGISVLFDVEELRLIEITDSFVGVEAPPSDFEVIEFHPSALDTRERLKPISISQNEGRNFSIMGSQVDWQNWRFHLRFDPRQGAILNNIGYITERGFRSVAYEIAMSEMVVPYQDPDIHWFYRAYFDMGEYGFGNMATELKGNDCPANAVYQDVMLHSAAGEPVVAPNRICIFEFDPGYPSWRHYESLYEGVPGIEKHNARRATNLVVRMVAVIGNYDYFQDYIFQQDGRVRIRLISTGIDATKGVFAAKLSDPTADAETQTGTLIAPYRLGVNHDHFFSYRIDMDVDGVENNFERQRLTAVPQPENADRQAIWAVTREKVENEQQARTTMRVEKPALLTFSSASVTNKMGYPASYQLMFPNIRPLVTLQDPIYQRAGFLKNNLWVTRYKRDEIFSTGIAVNQSAPGVGLPLYAADNESVKNADLVAWPTIGFHHVPMAEDWPVMPAKVDEIVLKPRNFFDRNPALDVPD
jgi:primary-amine oxidase